MKTTTLKLAITALCFAAASVNAMDNEPTGFRGIEWGASAASVQGLVETNIQALLQRNASRQFDLPINFPLKTYLRENDKQEFGGKPVGQTTYTFYRDQFVSSNITYTNSVGMHPQIGSKFPNTRNEADINLALVKSFGDTDLSKLSFFDAIKPSNSGLPSYSGSKSEIDNRCVAIGNHGKQISPPWLFDCTLQFRSTALFSQSKSDYSDYLNKLKTIRDETAGNLIKLEKSKPDF